MFEDFYRNKKVLITGHTGFKGAWLSAWLHELGAQVVGVALEPSHENTLYNVSGIKKYLTDYRQDIRDLVKIKKIFIREKPEIVFHLAAQALVLESYQQPVFTCETNILGTVNVMESIKSVGSVRSAVMITSDKCYENKESKEGFKEEDPLGGFDPYSSSKGAAELVIKAYRNSFFTSENVCNIASARAGNVIGGGDWAENRIIPDCVRAFENGEKVFLRKPAAVRPWQHVLEPLAGYLLLAKKLYESNLFSEAWNFGPNEQSNQPVKTLVEKFITYYVNGSYEFDTTEYPVEADFLSLDITKAGNKLGWYPVWNFNDTVKYTAEWYKKYKNTDVLRLTLNQINDFEKKWKSVQGN